MFNIRPTNITVLATEIPKLAGSITYQKIQLLRSTSNVLHSLEDVVETIRSVPLDAGERQW